MFFYTPTNNQTANSQAIVETKYLWFAFTFLSVLLASRINDILPKIEDRNNTLRMIFLYILCVLPPRAYIDGHEKAWQIQKNLVFDYTLADTIFTSKKTIVKFLGKTGDYYILMTLDNSKQIVLPTSELKHLILEKYSIDEPKSIQQFRINLKQIYK